MVNKFPHLIAAVMSYPWAIIADRLQAIAEVIERRVEGYRLSPDEIGAIKGDRLPNGVIAEVPVAAASGQPSPSNGQVVAVISCFGIIAQHASEVDDISGPGGTSTERLGASFRKALNDSNVKGIVFHINSPGGNVYGVQALAAEILAARGQKPIIAHANSLAASAAYWIASACDEIVVTPGGEVGSIGVYALHRDVSKAAEQEGFKFTFISAGKYKVEGNQFEPLGDEAHAAIQQQINAYYDDFTAGVANGRGVSQDEVKKGYGEGRCLKDKEAVKAGLADRIATLDDTIKRVASMKRPATGKAASAEVRPIPTDAKPVTLQKTDVDGAPTLAVVGEFPLLTVISRDLIDAADGATLQVNHDTGLVLFELSNGIASYLLEAVTEDGDWICALETSVTHEPAADAEQTAADRDAYRRRRHAHRHRR